MKAKKVDMDAKNTIPGSFSVSYGDDVQRLNEFGVCINKYCQGLSSQDQSCSQFPFQQTPSGNLKVTSKQVVFQSPTVGVLLADPTQAKVKVKFEEKPSDFQGDTLKKAQSLPWEPNAHAPESMASGGSRIKSSISNREADLASLGYRAACQIDWTKLHVPEKTDLYQELQKRIHNLMNTDFIIHVGSEEFHCHLLVLQAYSNYFDVVPSREVELPAEHVSAQAFQNVYDWMIFSDTESISIIRRDDCLDLLMAAQFLGIKDLEEQCWAFINNVEAFNEDSAFVLYQDAKRRNLTSVMDLMVPRIMRFFLPLVASKDFLKLDLDEVMSFLRSSFICVTSEIEVLMSAVRWLLGDWSERYGQAAQLMSCVRFGLLPPWQLVDVKRNPDNPEIMQVINIPQVQQMVDDGLAYVIIKYWYGNSSQNYYHWIDVLGLSEPAERNWMGEEKNHITYQDFLKYLDQFLVPKDQVYQLLDQVYKQPASHANGSEQGESRKRTINMMASPKTMARMHQKDEGMIPAMSELLKSRKKYNPHLTQLEEQSTSHQEKAELLKQVMQLEPDVGKGGRSRPDSLVLHHRQQEHLQMQIEHQKQILQHLEKQQSQMRGGQQPGDSEGKYIKLKAAKSTEHTSKTSPRADESGEDHSEPDSANTEGTSESGDHRSPIVKSANPFENDKRTSSAAVYLAAATAALASGRTASLQAPTTGSMQQRQLNEEIRTPQLSLFSESKERLARINMNKLSASVLGPANKNYMLEGSLFSWERETVLVFGGIDPHTTYGTGRNTGKDIYRFDPVGNVWEYVGDLPEPRHHHSVAFLKGRVYLVGGADPRDDDVRGKSVVVSTVWSYEPVSRSWYSETGMATPRKNFGLVAHRMALYAIGGQDKRGRVLRSVERFDSKSGVWSEVRALRVARMGVACAKYREYLWVAGGMTGDKRRPLTRSVECYSSATDQWTEIHDLRFPRCFATLFAMNDQLYLVGGAGRLSDKESTTSSVSAVDVWDVRERAWRVHTEMAIPRHGHALAYLGTQLIIIGGVTTIYMRALSNVESYCCERLAWIRGVAPLPAPLSGHGAVTLPPASLM